ncbi:hypothetical protein [Sphingomonas jaspsi]|uniref:hypothetical protein n=1 Tax=Sphingomonas jaspsi TaxID=392409 RepID=UPI0005611F20|nr:hypothetical protein [Sphingomonas jaspsi]
MSAPSVHDAMARADSAHQLIESHEDICAERYAHIHTAIGGVKETVSTMVKILAWGGSTLFGLLILIIGFLSTRAISTGDAEVAQLKTQIELLKMQQPPAAGQPPSK